MECIVLWTTYRNAICHVRITFRYADSFDEGAMPRIGAPFTVDYGKRFAHLDEALAFISKLNNESPNYLDVVYGR